MYNHKKIITKHKSRLHYGCTTHMTGYILWNKNQKNIKIMVLVFKRLTITEKKNNEIEKFHHHWIQEWETFKIVMLEKNEINRINISVTLSLFHVMQLSVKFTFSMLQCNLCNNMSLIWHVSSYFDESF